jgi:hypothetical protein
MRIKHVDVRLFGNVCQAKWPARRQAWVARHHQRGATHDQTIPRAISSYPALTTHSSRYFETYDAREIATTPRNQTTTTPPPCPAERYSRRTRTSPRRPMSRSQRPRSWAQYVRWISKLPGADRRFTERTASWHRPTACSREENPPGTQAPSARTYGSILTRSRPQILRLPPGSSSPSSQ